MDWVALVAPTSGHDRARRIAGTAGGFVYLVSMTGVTGGALSGVEHLEPIVREIRSAAQIPVCIGFGVRDGETAEQAAMAGDGVVVGSAVVSALGASIFFQNAVMLIYGARYQVYPHDILPRVVIPIFGLNVPLLRILILLTSVVMMAALYFFIQKTRFGTAIRAVAIDQGAAKLMGINVNAVIMIVFLIGPALGGAAGLMVGLYYGQINFTMGWIYGLKAFTAAILGGIGNIPGAMLGGLLLGVIEAMGAAYISIAWKDAIAFVVLILILIVRPTGLLGERVAEKV